MSKLITVKIHEKTRRMIKIWAAEQGLQMIEAFQMAAELLVKSKEKKS